MKLSRLPFGRNHVLNLLRPKLTLTLVGVVCMKTPWYPRDGYLLLPCSELRANLFVPSIPDPERLWALRHQYFTANDRLCLQTRQQQLPGLMTKFDFICMAWSSFFSENVGAGPRPEVVVLDPLVASA